jgi:hypothetical protein
VIVLDARTRILSLAEAPESTTRADLRVIGEEIAPTPREYISS